MRCSSPISIKDPRQNLGSIRLEVPCGKCGQCKANRRIQWSFRLKEELLASNSAWFVTMTYQNSHLPRAKNGRPSLSKRDLQLFMKRVRKENKKFTDDKLTYYAVGEYGSKTLRPHYHVILFNIDMDVVKRLESYWTDDKGHRKGQLHTRPVNGARIHYVTKYHVNPDRNKHKRLGVEAEFAHMSKGIGKGYVKRGKEWHTKSGRNYVMNGGYKQLLPRYLREKIFPESGVIFKQIQMASVTKDSDTRYAEEVERLMKEGIHLPTEVIDFRNRKESDRIQQETKRKDQI